MEGDLISLLKEDKNLFVIARTLRIPREEARQRIQGLSEADGIPGKVLAKYTGNNYKDWTPEEDGNLRKLFQERVRIPEIAQTLQRSDRAIWIRLRTLGITEKKTPKTDWTPLCKEIVALLIGARVKSEELGKILSQVKKEYADIVYQIEVPEMIVSQEELLEKLNAYLESLGKSGEVEIQTKAGMYNVLVAELPYPISKEEAKSFIESLTQ